MLRKTLFVIAATMMVVSAQAQQGKGGPPPPQPQKIEQIAPNFYVVTGAGGNVGVRVTPEGLILVDTKNLGDQFYNDLMAQIKTVSNLPVKYVIVTHHHQDHSGNIQKFQDAGATVYVQENLNKNLQTYAPPQGKPAAAKNTYVDSQYIKLGGADVRIYHYEPAHTSGDSLVLFYDGAGAKILMTGDVVVGVAPNVDYPFGGSLTGWSQTLDRILKLDFDLIIPGHSGPNQTYMTKTELRAYKQKIDLIIARGAELVKKGVPKDQLLAQIRTDDIGWNVNGAPWNQPARLDAMYAELGKAK